MLQVQSHCGYDLLVPTARDPTHERPLSTAVRRLMTFLEPSPSVGRPVFVQLLSTQPPIVECSQRQVPIRPPRLLTASSHSATGRRASIGPPLVTNQQATATGWRPVGNYSCRPTTDQIRSGAPMTSICFGRRVVGDYSHHQRNSQTTFLRPEVAGDRDL